MPRQALLGAPDEKGSFGCLFLSKNGRSTDPSTFRWLNAS
jgi:hypothetical protein